MVEINIKIKNDYRNCTNNYIGDKKIKRTTKLIY